MDSRFIRRLHGELALWTQNGWISPAQAALLAGHYPLSQAQGREWWQVLLSVLAALCVGAGIIALFAANWHVLSRGVRVGLSLAPLLLGQGACLFALLKRPQSVAWRESSALFTAVAVGAAIALVAQTYHIESSNMFVRLWLWLTLPMVYLARSWAAAFFVLFLVQAFAFTQMDFFYGGRWWAGVWEYLAYSLALLPWLFFTRRRGQAYAAQAGVWRSFVTLMVFATVFAMLLYAQLDMACMWVLVGSVYLAVSTLGPSLMQRAGMVFLGSTMLLMAESGMFWWQRWQFADAYALALLAIVALFFALPRWRRLAAWDVAFVLCGAALVATGITVPVPEDGYPWLVTAVIVVLGLWQLHRSLHNGDLVTINAALLWVLFALYLRFVEESMPLWIKGIVFILAGSAIYTLNIVAARARRKGVSA
ncbi:MAG: DUF2157 domain-containing protein [Cardiobacteriaceae bacterium]|nr:DUF2157 domain-containing protein [Cardiobacteriaceae bacterium]